MCIRDSSTAGTYTYTVTATSQGKTKQATFTLTVVEPQEDFAISLSPSSVTVNPGEAISVTVTVSPSPSYPYTVSLSPERGSVSPSSSTPEFKATWSLTAPSTAGTYQYTIIGYGGDGKVRSATLTVTVKAPSTPYWQGYIEYIDHYYVVDDVKVELRFMSPLDWSLTDEDSAYKTLKKGWYDEWSANKLAYGDFIEVLAYAKTHEYTTTNTQVINKYYYDSSWHNAPPANGVFMGYKEYSESHRYHKASITVTGSLPSTHFWTIDDTSPFDKAKYSEGANYRIEGSCDSSSYSLIGKAGYYRVKTKDDLGVKEGSCEDLTLSFSYSWTNGRDSGSGSKTIRVRLAWIKPEVHQVWLSPHTCVIRVYGVWSDDNGKVTGRPYLYYGVDYAYGRVYCDKTGITSDGWSYVESKPINPIELRPPSYNVKDAFKLRVTPAHTDMALMGGTVEYRELAISVLQRDDAGIKLRVYEWHEPYDEVANARITLIIKDLATNAIKEYTKAVNDEGWAYWPRSELELPERYELWAYAWGTKNTIFYARSNYGGILLERNPPTPQ